MSKDFEFARIQSRIYLPFSQFYDDCEENRRIKNYDTELAFPKPGRRARLATDSQPQKQV